MSTVTDALAQVEDLAATLYADDMGAGWPVPYADLTVTQQEQWRGPAYCAVYALSICPMTKTPHPWLRSWCEPSCRTQDNPDARVLALAEGADERRQQPAARDDLDALRERR